MENKDFFDSFEDYDEYVLKNQGDVYKNTQLYLNEKLKHAEHVLDIGNGGVMNYDFSNFDLDCLDISVCDKTREKYAVFNNVKFFEGDALALPFENDKYDAVIIQYVIHHLVAANKVSAKEKLKLTEHNVRKCINEAIRVTGDEGSVFIIEPVVPEWFFFLEKIFFAPLLLFCKLLRHGEVFQFSKKALTSMIADTLGSDKYKLNTKIIDPGKSIVIFKVPVPAFLAPMKIYVFEISKR